MWEQFHLTVESCLSLQIKKASFADDNFSVSVSKSANEVVATYTKDETGMDLVIRLPPSYPLRPVDVDCTRSLGISEVKRRKWLMSLISFVRNQVFPADSVIYTILGSSFPIFLVWYSVFNQDHSVSILLCTSFDGS